MKFDPNAVEEKKDFPVLKAGDYEFEVENATYKKSKTGGLMWEVVIRVDPTDGQQPSKVWVYFPERQDMDWKFAQFFKCLGMEVNDTDEMKNTIGEIGRCTLRVREAEGPYPAKNEVAKFIKKEDELKRDPAVTIASDDLPF